MSTRHRGIGAVGVALALGVSLASFAQSTGMSVREDEKHNVHVAAGSGKETVLAREPDQVGIDEVKVAEDQQTAGWLILYKDPDGSSPFAGKLVVWRDGRILRSFAAEQVFWSWSFEHGGEQVAYHVGPTHGETASHCELHDLRTGRRLASWDGDLESSARPAWTKKLDH
jgi:hypothetical protein